MVFGFFCAPCLGAGPSDESPGAGGSVSGALALRYPDEEPDGPIMFFTKFLGSTVNACVSGMSHPMHGCALAD